MNIGVLFFAVGVVCLQVQAALPPHEIPLVLAGGLLLLARYRRPWRRVAGWIACFLLGMAWAGWRADMRLAEHLPEAWEGRDIVLQGVVAALPEAFERGLRFEFVVDRVLTAEAVVPGRIQLAWYRPEGNARLPWPEVQPGERWQLTARLKRPHGSANPGGFDYEAWLLERGIRATGYVRPVAAERLGDPVFGPVYLVERWRAAIRARFAALLPAGQWPWGGVLVALVIGDQKGIEVEI